MKKLIAAAVAAAVIAPAGVMAAGPTLYGKIHMSVDYKDNNTSNNEGTKYKEWGLSSNSSRIGVKGSEDLGNGMKVGYLIEWRVGMDGDDRGDKDLATRNRAVTLSGDWGTMLAGKWDTPFKTVGRKLDLFGDRVGDMRDMNSGAKMDLRTNNTVAYVTPNMNGLTATVAYVFDATGASASDNAKDQGKDTTGDNADNSAWSFSTVYKNGPLMAAVAYTDIDNTLFSATGAENQKTWRVGGSYKFGDLKVLATYTDIANAKGYDGKDAEIWQLGAAYTMGNNVIKFQYADRSEYDNYDNFSNVRQSGKDTGADMFVIGLDHKMSKRTTVYVTYADMDNDKNANGIVWSGGHDKEGDAPAKGNDSDAFSVGIIHKF